MLLYRTIFQIRLIIYFLFTEWNGQFFRIFLFQQPFCSLPRTNLKLLINDYVSFCWFYSSIRVWWLLITNLHRNFELRRVFGNNFLWNATYSHRIIFIIHLMSDIRFNESKILCHFLLLRIILFISGSENFYNKYTEI